MIRVRWVLAALLLIVLVGVLLLQRRAQDGFARADQMERERLAGRIFDSMESELSEILASEEQRSVLDWRPRSIRGGVEVRSPLADPPANPWVLGYFEVGPAGELRFPRESDAENVGGALSLAAAEAASIREIIGSWVQALPKDTASRQTTAAVTSKPLGKEKAQGDPTPSSIVLPVEVASLDLGSEATTVALGGAAAEEAQKELSPSTTKEPLGKSGGKREDKAKEKMAAKDSSDDLLALEQTLNKGASKRSKRAVRQESLEPSNAQAYQSLPAVTSEAPAPTRLQAAVADPPAQAAQWTTSPVSAEPVQDDGIAAVGVLTPSENVEVDGLPAPVEDAEEAVQDVAHPPPTPRRRPQPVVAMVLPAPSPLDVEIAPFTATPVPGGFVLSRVVRAGTERFHQGLVIDEAALSRHLEEATLDEKLRSYVSARWVGAVGLTHRFASPFGGLQAGLEISSLPRAGPDPAIWTRRLAWGLVAALLLGLFAVERMVSVVLAFAQRRSDFVSAVSHELKTPLTSLRMYAEMLDEGIVRDEGRRAAYYKTLRTESERLTRLVDQVLELSRLERGTRTLRWEVGPVAPVLADVGDLLRPRAAELDFEIAVEVEEGLPPLRYDRDAVVQILMNLADNAMKFSRKASDRRIHLVARREGGGVCVGVRDHGPGVPRDQLRRIFEPFYRGERELVRETKGTGIGLAVVRGLARAMGGDVVAAPGEGGGLWVAVAVAEG